MGPEPRELARVTHREPLKARASLRGQEAHRGSDSPWPGTHVITAPMPVARIPKATLSTFLSVNVLKEVESRLPPASP